MLTVSNLVFQGKVIWDIRPLPYQEIFPDTKVSAFYENILFDTLKCKTHIVSNALLQQHSLYSISLYTKQAKRSKPGLKIVTRVYY